MSSVAAATASPLTAEPEVPRRVEATRFVTTPLVLAAILVGLYLWVHSRDLDSIEQRTLNRAYLIDAVLAQLKITVLASTSILLIAVPLGIVLSRRRSR